MISYPNLFLSSATDYLQREGPVLVTDLTAQFAGEMVGLIDNYAARVNHSINHQVGCHISGCTNVHTYIRDEYVGAGKISA